MPEQKAEGNTFAAIDIRLVTHYFRKRPEAEFTTLRFLTQDNSRHYFEGLATEPLDRGDLVRLLDQGICSLELPWPICQGQLLYLSPDGKVWLAEADLDPQIQPDRVLLGRM